MPTPERHAPAPAPDRYAVVGHPVAHSRSPFIHAEFAKETGQRIQYERLLAPLEGFENTVREFAAAGGRGCNVTVPFKFDAYRICPRHSPRAELAQAANVIRFDTQGWFADNSDGAGLVADIEHGASQAIAGIRVLLIGAGGAGAGVLGPLLSASPAELVVANRTVQRAHELVQRHHTLARAHGVSIRASGLTDAGKGFDLIINASASSLSGQASPVPVEVLKPGALAVDLMYGSAAKGFLDWARQQGARARDGLGMLVEQAAESFFIWRGIRPLTAPVLLALRAQIDSGPPKS